MEIFRPLFRLSPAQRHRRRHSLFCAGTVDNVKATATPTAIILGRRLKNNFDIGFRHGPAKEKHQAARPQIISDNGPQFIAQDFKELIRTSGMAHVRTSPYYPQSRMENERWHKSLKRECIQPETPMTPEDARRLIQSYVEHLQHGATAQRGSDS
jgi:transposase InsO family protein